MISTFRAVTLVTASLLSLGFAGCGSTKPARYYMLHAAAEARAEDPTDGDQRLVGLGPVRVASYLDRQQIVTRRSDNALDINDFHRWAEPLEDAVSRMIRANLTGLEPQWRVLLFPWRSVDQVDIAVRLDIRRLDGVLGGDARLEADWLIDCGRDHRIFSGTGDALVQPVDGMGYEALARAESLLLRALSERLAGDLRSCPAR